MHGGHPYFDNYFLALNCSKYAPKVTTFILPRLVKFEVIVVKPYDIQSRVEVPQTKSSIGLHIMFPWKSYSYNL